MSKRRRRRQTAKALHEGLRAYRLRNYELIRKLTQAQDREAQARWQYEELRDAVVSWDKEVRSIFGKHSAALIQIPEMLVRDVMAPVNIPLPLEPIALRSGVSELDRVTATIRARSAALETMMYGVDVSIKEKVGMRLHLKDTSGKIVVGEYPVLTGRDRKARTLEALIPHIVKDLTTAYLKVLGDDE